MKTIKYNYRSTITFENVILHFNNFKNEVINNVKYIKIHIKLIHSTGPIEVELCHSTKKIFTVK